jgi:hypothetical protein
MLHQRYEVGRLAIVFGVSTADPDAHLTGVEWAELQQVVAAIELFVAKREAAEVEQAALLETVEGPPPEQPPGRPSTT